MLRLEVLGGFRLLQHGRDVPGLRQNRVLAALLVMLAMERRCGRESVMATLWPESDAENARHALRQALYRLRQHLGRDDWLLKKDDELFVADVLQCDATEFDAAVSVGALEAAAALYRGPYLNGVHLLENRLWQQWVDAQRLRLARAFRATSRERIHAALAADDLNAAIAAAYAWVAPDPGDDEAQHQLIELLVRAGDRAAAITQYEAFTRVLAADGLTPLDETTALYNELVTADPELVTRPVPPVQEGSRSQRPPRRQSAKPGRWAVLAAAVTAAAFLAAFAFISALTTAAGGSNPGSGQLVRFQLTPPPDVRIERLGPISPTGTHVVFAGFTQSGERALWLQPLDRVEAVRLTGTDDAMYPFWSPDGKHIGFSASDGSLRKVDVRGGPSELISEQAFVRGGATWSADGIIVFSPAVGGPLWRIGASGGEPERLTQLDTLKRQLVHQWPVFLPDGKHFLYVAREMDGRFVTYAASLEQPDRPKRIGILGSAFTWAPGYLLYLRGTMLMAQPFDHERLELVGQPTSIAGPLTLTDPHAYGPFWASGNGILVYQARSPESTQLVWLDRGGRVLGTLGPPGIYRSFALAPDGRRAVVERFGSEPGHSDLWLLDGERDVPTRLTFDPWQESCLVWAPAARITYCSSRAGRWDIVQMDAMAGAEPTVLLEGRGSGSGPAPVDISPDGRTLLFHDGAQPVHLLDLTSETGPVPLSGTQKARQPQFSPDGRYIAFPSSESGEPQVYVLSLGPDRTKWQVSRTAGGRAHWRSDGREIVYITPGRTMMSVEVDPGPPFRLGRERVLFTDAAIERCAECGDASTAMFAMTHDAERFLVMQRVEPEPMPVTVVLNWMASIAPEF